MYESVVRCLTGCCVRVFPSLKRRWETNCEIWLLSQKPLGHYLDSSDGKCWTRVSNNVRFFSSTGEAISAWPLSNIFCINSRVCCCLLGSRFRLKSKDLALLRACSLLLAKGVDSTGRAKGLSTFRCCLWQNFIPLLQWTSCLQWKVLWFHPSWFS